MTCLKLALRPGVALRSGALLISIACAHSQPFMGTNSPGTAQNFTFNVGPGATNLSVSVANSETNFSHLFLRKGAAPSAGNFDFASQLDGTTNAINLELPELVATNHGLAVSTPTNSETHEFVVTVESNLAEMRSAALPVWKPQATTITGALTNQQFHYFHFEIPTNSPGWRLVLNCASSNAAALYLRRGALPTENAYDRRVSDLTNATMVLTESQIQPGTYFVGVYQSEGTNNYTLYSEVGYYQALTWDPGLTPEGTEIYTNTSVTGGDYYFKIIAQPPGPGAWRTALRVLSGAASVSIRKGDLPDLVPGARGLVLHSSEYNPAEEWFIRVQATAGAQWTLVSGDVFVYDLGAVAPNSSNGTNVNLGPEGMAFFKTTVPANTLAWSLWLHGSPNELRVRKSFVPHPISYVPGEPVPQSGRMLVVPNFLAGDVVDGYYYICIPGSPGETIQLDSRAQSVTDIPFATTNELIAVTNGGYRVFRIQVPVEQIAWQVKVLAQSGNPNFAIRRSQVPNEWNNDAFSEVSAPIIDSLTLVPPSLADGTFFITVYGAPPYSFTLESLNPVITDVPFIGSNTNADLNRVGWRYYRVIDIASQLGYLGWELLIKNAPPGTEIALRRNAVPGNWNYRADNSTDIRQPFPAPVNYSSNTGELQRPGHQADIWYIGVYNPISPMDAFTLIRRALVAQTVPFQSATSQTNVPAGHWDFYRIDVPTNALGWDVRLVNVSSGTPRLVVARDLLPDGEAIAGPWPRACGDCPPSVGTNWPSGAQWLGGVDWTGYALAADGENAPVSMMAIGRGAPLQPGTYYVGILAKGTSSYTLQSRGIGDGFSIPVNNLDFSGGTATNAALAARETAYYRVTIPSNTPSWHVKLTPGAEMEALLLVQKDSLPNAMPNRGSWADTAFGWDAPKRMQKMSHDHYVLFAADGTTHLETGAYYLGVVSEGMQPQPSENRIGAGNSGYLLQSLGAMPVLSFGIVTTNYIDQPDAIEGGELKIYQFVVSPGTAGVEVTLEERTGNPGMVLRPGPEFPNAFGGPHPDPNFGRYGFEGGQDSGRQSDFQIITRVNPDPGIHTLVVRACASNGQVPDASYTLRLRAIESIALGFDGGTSSVNAQPNRSWRFFQMVVPTNALGWDVRLNQVTEGNPRLVIRRDLLPDSLNDSCRFGRICRDPFCHCLMPWTAIEWTNGHQWAAEIDWTGFLNAADGSPESGRIQAMGMGNPLEPGLFYVGVYAEGQSSYTLQSRGIGQGFAIPVVELDYASGTATNALPIREAAYYRVQVPSNAPSWKVRLGCLAGDALLLAQKGALPNIGANRANWLNNALDLSGGKRMQKAGNEHYLLLPIEELGQTNIEGGTYYLAAVAEGVNPDPTQSRIGTGQSEFVLQSQGPLPELDLGVVLPGSALRVTNVLLEGGELTAYRFSVPAGTPVVEAGLEQWTGNPGMTLRPGPQFPRPYSYDYGIEGGYYSEIHQDLNLITLSNPTNSVHHLLVQARSGGANQFSDATYVLRVQSLPITTVAFDGGNSTITDQLPNNWKFFQIEVPPNALGWDLRLIDVFAGNPRLVIRRDLLPDSLDDSCSFGRVCRDPFCHCQMPWTAIDWTSGHQWAADIDWTGFLNAADGSPESGRIQAVGMGNPLEPGTYYVGVYAEAQSSYTLQSRGIGDGFAIPVVELDYAGGTVTNALPIREAAYYRVQVPSNAPSWKVRLGFLAGDTLLLAQKGALPNIGANRANWLNNALDLSGGKRMQKAGNEHYLLLPVEELGQTNIEGGTYYLAAVAEGINPDRIQNRIGTGQSEFVLQSQGSLPELDLGVVLPGSASQATNALLEGGEIAAYRFSVPVGTATIEARLEKQDGNLGMTLRAGPQLPRSYNDPVYGTDGGYNSDVHQHLNLITLPNPQSGTYRLLVQAIGENEEDKASYELRVANAEAPLLNFTASQNTNGLTNSIGGQLGDNQRAFFRVEIPATINGQALIGWQLDLTLLQGNASVRVRKNALPNDLPDTSPHGTNGVYVVPPYLSPGTWYVEVHASAAAHFTLTSSALVPGQVWLMPEPGQPTTTPGLSGLEFGDSGTDPNGLPILDPQTGTVTDRGIDLQNGRFHFYAIVVPTNNIGVFRTTVEALNGTPELYLRTTFPPSLSHSDVGWFGNGHPELVDRRHVGAATKYGNWVVLGGRETNSLPPGTWYLGIRAAGNSNCRYRLQVAQANVQNLTLNGGSFTNQQLFGGDWRYYRLQIPSNAPSQWTISFAQQVGDVIVYVRDLVPPGFGTDSNGYRDWATDHKNQGPYSAFDLAGNYTLTEPPLRPGHTYYLGFRAINDAMFSVASSTSGSTLEPPQIPFYNGFVSNMVSPNGFLLFRINVPADARRWISYATNNGNLQLYLEQGTVPIPVIANAHLWSAPDETNVAWNINPIAPGNWPWVRGQSYFLLVTNIASTPEPFTFTLHGQNQLTDDQNSDGLPDAWQEQYFGNYGHPNAAPSSDPDSDGLNNSQEWQLGTHPLDDRTPGRFAGVEALPGGTNRFHLLGEPGQRYCFEASSDLVDWTQIVCVTNDTGVLVVIDPRNTNYLFQFYRSRLLISQ